MRKMFACMIVLSALVLSGWLHSGRALEPEQGYLPDGERNAIDVAICLDTSGSMKALLEAARLKLWAVVNDLALAEPTPRLRVALVTYGNRYNDPREKYVKVESDLTEDLDSVSQRLFELTAEGGVEYVGQVLTTTLRGLAWTTSEEALKLVFVTGNEPADQYGEVNFQDMGVEASEGGIFVNVIYCGRQEENNAESWKEMAELVQGQFATIDHRRGTIIVDTPFDSELIELSAAINDTYLPVGQKGRERLQIRVEQDRNARQLSPAAAAGRAQTKAGLLYAASWDLVDALETGKVFLDELVESELPAVMRDMSFADRELYIQQMKIEREELRQRIAELSDSRRRYIVEQIEAKGLDDSRAFDTALRQTIRQKAEEKGFTFPGR